MRNSWMFLAALCLGACARHTEQPLLGTLEWDRVELLAEAGEPVTVISVREGQRVRTGDVLLQLDARRAAGDVAAIDAEIARLDAVLAEQRNGARAESVAEASARLNRARTLATNAAQELERARGLREKRLNSPADLDRALASSRAADAETRAAAAALQLLTNGTRPEQTQQTEAALAAQHARRDVLALTLERLTVRAPRDGRVDAIPVEVGDQVTRGAPLISLLVGEAPYARVFVPERLRVGLNAKADFRVTLVNDTRAFDAHLRYVRAEPSFTPYYALHGDDASRLSYLAEFDLLGPGTDELPAGLPLAVALAAPR